MIDMVSSAKYGGKMWMNQTGQTPAWQTPVSMAVLAWLNWTPDRDDTPGTSTDLDRPDKVPEPIPAELSELTPVLSDVVTLGYWKTWQEASRRYLDTIQRVDQEDIRQDVVLSVWRYGVRQLEKQDNPKRGVNWIPKRVRKAVERLRKESAENVAHIDETAAKAAAELRYAERQEILHKDYLRQVTEDLLQNNPRPVKTECLMKW